MICCRSGRSSILIPTSQHVLARQGTEKPRDHHVGSEQCDKRPSRHRRYEPTLLAVGFDCRRSSVRRLSVSAGCTRIASGGRIETQARTAGSGSADESTCSPAIPVFFSAVVRQGRRPALIQGRTEGSDFQQPMFFSGNTANQRLLPGVRTRSKRAAMGGTAVGSTLTLRHVPGSDGTSRQVRASSLR